MSTLQVIGLACSVVGTLAFVASGAVTMFSFTPSQRQPNGWLMIGGATVALAGALVGWIAV